MLEFMVNVGKPFVFKCHDLDLNGLLSTVGGGGLQAPQGKIGLDFSRNIQHRKG